jgi:hypothetical protein
VSNRTSATEVIENSQRWESYVSPGQAEDSDDQPITGGLKIIIHNFTPTPELRMTIKSTVDVNSSSEIRLLLQNTGAEKNATP